VEAPTEEERKKKAEENKVKRLELFENFAKPGNSGAKFKKVLERMEKALVSQVI